MVKIVTLSSFMTVPVFMTSKKMSVAENSVPLNNVVIVKETFKNLMLSVWSSAEHTVSAAERNILTVSSTLVFYWNEFSSFVADSTFLYQCDIYLPKSLNLLSV